MCVVCIEVFRINVHQFSAGHVLALALFSNDCIFHSGILIREWWWWWCEQAPITATSLYGKNLLKSLLWNAGNSNETEHTGGHVMQYVEGDSSACCIKIHYALRAFLTPALPERQSNFNLCVALYLSIHLNAHLLFMQAMLPRGEQLSLPIPPPFRLSTFLEPAPMVSDSEESGLIRKKKNGRSAIC